MGNYTTSPHFIHLYLEHAYPTDSLYFAFCSSSPHWHYFLHSTPTWLETTKKHGSPWTFCGRTCSPTASFALWTPSKLKESWWCFSEQRYLHWFNTHDPKGPDWLNCCCLGTRSLWPQGDTRAHWFIRGKSEWHSILRIIQLCTCWRHDVAPLQSYKEWYCFCCPVENQDDPHCVNSCIGYIITVNNYLSCGVVNYKGL